MSDKNVWRFSTPKLRRPLSAKAQRVLDNLAAAAEKIAANPHLSEAGKRAEFTTQAKLALSSLKEHDASLRAEIKTVLRERAALRDSKRPSAPSMADRQELLELARMARESKEGREYFFQLLNAKAGSDLMDEHVERLQYSFLSLNPHVLGPHGARLGQQYQILLRQRLGVDQLGTEGEKLDEREMAATGEIEALRSVRLATMAAADREELAKGGFAPKPVAQWTHDEKIAFIHANGQDEYMRVILEEQQMNASATMDRIEEGALKFVDPPASDPATAPAVA